MNKIFLCSSLKRLNIKLSIIYYGLQKHKLRLNFLFPFLEISKYQISHCFISNPQLSGHVHLFSVLKKESRFEFFYSLKKYI